MPPSHAELAAKHARVRQLAAAAHRDAGRHRDDATAIVLTRR